MMMKKGDQVWYKKNGTLSQLATIQKVGCDDPSGHYYQIELVENKKVIDTLLEYLFPLRSPKRTKSFLFLSFI